MNVFPQLAQLPIRRRRVQRTVINEAPDGRRVKLADTGSAATEWTLGFAELGDAEIQTLEQFFTSMEGQLGSFTFLDPADNLLYWSEKPDEAEWEKDPLLEVAAGDGYFHVSNPTVVPLRLVQTLNAPAWFCYSISAMLRGAGQATLVCGDVTGARDLRAEWSRLVLSGQTQNMDELVRFGLEIPAGGSLDVAWMQVEAQTGASAYKKTSSRGGVYPEARFASDSLEVTTSGPGRHACALKILHADHI